MPVLCCGGPARPRPAGTHGRTDGLTVDDSVRTRTYVAYRAVDYVILQYGWLTSALDFVRL